MVQAHSPLPPSSWSEPIRSSATEPPTRSIVPLRVVGARLLGMRPSITFTAPPIAPEP
ncbi:MAG: hypothetical protein OXH70_21005 [Acidobacteria bacterium]|nr:hypothetical protein [Acidobacteriota bacterium]